MLQRTSLKESFNVLTSKNIRWAVMIILNYYGSNLTDFYSAPKFGGGGEKKERCNLYLTKVQKGVYHSGIKVFNCLPTRMNGLSNDVRTLKSALKGLLFEGSFYTIQEYFDLESIIK
jgi:hypothetical protein